MQYSKKVIASMPKAYAIGTFDGADARSFVIGVEKDGPIRRFALDGTPMETVTEGPGGVMTIAQVPGRNDQLLATSEFFSPNYGSDTAGIVAYTRAADGTWSSNRICDLPYVHRFGLLTGADGQLWLIACTIKGACRQIKNDWLTPGAVYVAKLGDALESEQVELTYRSELNDHPFEELLLASRARDLANEFTTSGIHRDDLVLRIGGYPLRKYGSQGQQKSFLIALKLAQYAVVAEACGERPILLLDDLFDKLDAGRVEQLIRLVSEERFGQIFISDCNPTRLRTILDRAGADYTLFEVEHGTIKQ